MRILRFSTGVSPRGPISPPPEEIRWGLLDGDRVRELNSPPFDGLFPGTAEYGLPDVTIEPPVVPTKVVAIGWNYAEHIREMDSPFPEEPLIFLKAPSSIVPHGATIILPPESERVDFEGELAIVIGRRCRRVSRDRAGGVIFGYTILNDVTARDLQRKDGQFARAKSFDTFCPLGPWIETELDPGSVQVSARVNGELRQDDNTSTMLFDPFFLVEYVSAAMTLEAGDIIATGTPSGVGPLSPGDTVQIVIGGIGELANPVRREGDAP